MRIKNLTFYFTTAVILTIIKLSANFNFFKKLKIVDPILKKYLV
jgi:hypothetical protein